MSNLTIESKASIDELVIPLRRIFLPDRDFNPIFKQLAISYFIDYFFTTRLTTTEDGERFLFSYPRLFRATKEFGIGHELGHLVLGHQEGGHDLNVSEQEAEYFSTQLTGHGIRKYMMLLLVETTLLNILKKDFRRGGELLEHDPVAYERKLVEMARNSSPVSYD